MFFSKKNSLFDNIGIKSKLLILITIPLLGLMFFSYTTIANSYKTSQTMEDIEKLHVLSKKVSILLDSTQEERRLSVLYIHDKENSIAQLKKTQNTTNKNIKNFKEYFTIVEQSFNKKSFKEIYKNTKNILDNINSIRNNTSKKNIKINGIIKYYSKLNQTLLDILVLSAKESDNIKISQELTAYSSFLYVKENASIEQSIGISTLNKDSFDKNTQSEFNNLIASQNSYLANYFQYASKDMKNIANKILKDKAIEKIENMRTKLLQAKDIGGFNIDSIHWFDTLTKKINTLKEIEGELTYAMRIEDIKLFEKLEVASRISDLLHATQKEIAASSGYLASKGTSFTKKLKTERYETNFRIKELKNSIDAIDKNLLNEIVKKDIQNILTTLTKLEDIRKNIDKLNLNEEKSNEYFTSINKALLNTFWSISDAATTVEENKDVLAYYSFTLAKERAGIERSIGANAFAKNKFTGNQKALFVKLITEQDNYMTMFKKNASADIVELYEATINDKELKDKVFDEVTKLRNIALENETIGGFGIKPNSWIKNYKIKNSKLLEIDNKISQVIKEDITALKNRFKTILYTTASLSFIALIIILFISQFISKKILTALFNFKKGLSSFFKYAVRESENVDIMDVKGKDEFAQMTKEMNEQIIKTQNFIEQDRKVVKEIDEVMGKVSNGFFCYTIKQEGATKEIEALKNNINSMLIATKQRLDNINTVLDHFASNNFNYDLDENKKDGLSGDIGSLYTSTKILGTSISSLLAMIDNAGEELKDSTDILSNSSQNLSSSSNKQAASLEETAAAVEQITSNIVNNNQNVNRMSQISDELKDSAIHGDQLAHKTSSSMNDINERVNDINNAIEVIDQIAFQTNILSLNAAVEAATAGEAGKGFAVVAGEVRNLAARSAEAANEIKSIVEQASLTSKEGKVIASQMILGYKKLNEKVSQTKEIIDDVSIVSKEQEAGMNQINDVINSLDKTTQENASEAGAIDNLSSDVSVLSKRLSSITSEANFDRKIKEHVHDINLVNLFAKYKNDYINFKDSIFTKLNSYESWNIEKAKDSQLGQWIEVQESNQIAYTKTNHWGDLKKIHNNLHKYLQEYINENANKNDNNTLKNIAVEIEQETLGFFNQLDKILEVNSKILKQSK